MSGNNGRRLVAFVGSYADGPGNGPGGVDLFEVSPDGRDLIRLDRSEEPCYAGYLVYSPELSTLYAVDERKTDGRGPVQPPAAVHALRVDPVKSTLEPLNHQITVGPRPTFLSVSGRLLVSANHGDFDHVEHVVPGKDGGWEVEYLYDDSTVVVYGLGADGRIENISDVQVYRRGGTDPNSSPQAGGHGQASGHAHCAVIDPSGRYVIVCDKATDLITVYELGAQLKLASTLQFPSETGPRHIAFDALSDRAYLTLEFSSELASLRFDATDGTFEVLDRVRSTADTFSGLNEPAEVRVHPNGTLVYLNNRGEDSLAWFSVDAHGRLKRLGQVPLAQSVHPGLAARSFVVDPTGSLLLVADRPANLVRSYGVDGATGALQALAEISVPDPAYIEFAELPS